MDDGSRIRGPEPSLEHVDRVRAMVDQRLSELAERVVPRRIRHQEWPQIAIPLAPVSEARRSAGTSVARRSPRKRLAKKPLIEMVRARRMSMASQAVPKLQRRRKRPK